MQTSSMYLNEDNRKSIDDFKMILQSVSQYDEMLMHENNGTTASHGTNGTNVTNGTYGIYGTNGTYRTNDTYGSNGTIDKQPLKAANTESNDSDLDYSIFDDERAWTEDMCRIQ